MIQGFYWFPQEFGQGTILPTTISVNSEQIPSYTNSERFFQISSNQNILIFWLLSIYLEFLNFAGNSRLFRIFSRLPENQLHAGSRIFVAVVAPGAALHTQGNSHIMRDLDPESGSAWRMQNCESGSRRQKSPKFCQNKYWSPIFKKI